MKHCTTYLLYSLMIFTVAIGLVGCSADSATTTDTPELAETEAIKGPNGGRLLSDGDFAIEVTIFETGVDPQFRLYAYQDGEPLSPDQVDLTLELKRLGDQVDRFKFSPQGNYLVGDGIVTEPHSFVVTINARYNGRASAWTYDAIEGRTEIADALAKAAGITTEIAGAATVDISIPVTGKITFAPGATAKVKSPYTARVLSITKSVGDRVGSGETLALLENVSTLQPLTITAPFNGVVIERNTNVGDVAGSQALFAIGDTSQMEARLHIFPKDRQKVTPGLAVKIETPIGDKAVQTEISAYMPMADPLSQTLIARTPVPADAGFYPGMRVNGEIVVETIDAPLAVRTSGLQRFRDFTVVFARVDETYEVRMLDLGARDREWAVVHGGLEPGTEYVTANAFLLKADVEKSGAGHDH
ncbi:HlyD family efflux transporter periplasmic adaptor subunit [Exilibacterium tricleocarpae]|uniref:HlyD family efflux transporter periplasmic adaptor subunit n=1 Tax=Exilibacterium tricleocarpae TaxID=2591008 RepID=A0A545STF4_9GAMM|nr:efflux RND transporter periplasmic adaptor subunit [Exilibacterium tricleocarpae]TQV68239.1 HlyD family efflux transporter periplasmic adaptor subunit [Exilibacterium tricleocarpae]